MRGRVQISSDIRAGTLLEELEELEEQIDSMDYADALRQALQKIEERLFETSGRSGAHGAWKPTRAGNPPLVRTGRLRSSLTSDTGDSVWQVNKARGRVRLGTRVPYAPYQEDRRPIDVSGAQADDLARAMEEAIAKWLP